MEVELKFRAPEGIEKRIEGIGARFLGESHERDIHYDRAGELREKGMTLRVRHTASGKELTYKGPQTREDVKALEEINVPVDGDIDEVFHRLGFQEDKVVTKEKRRVSYEFDGVTVNVDDVEKLGRFVELEVITDDADDGKARLMAVAEKLGLKDPITISYPQMLRELNTSGD
jgi:adenylate cyclase class 2